MCVAKLDGIIRGHFWKSHCAYMYISRRPDFFRRARICIFSLFFSISCSLVAPEKARGFIKIPRRKKLRCTCRAVCAIDLRRHRRQRWWRRRRRMVPSIIFPRGSNFADVRRFGNVITLLSPPRMPDVSRMKDFRREIILIALNKPRFTFITCTCASRLSRWSRWLNKLPDRDLIQHIERTSWFCARTKKGICFCTKSIFSRLKV